MGLDMNVYLEFCNKKFFLEIYLLVWGILWCYCVSFISGFEENLYDLYVVCNYIGGMIGGYYMVYCKNFVDVMWYLFDDMCVERISECQIVIKVVYFLFYV